MARGPFITFEGGDGTGKSTNVAFVSKLLSDLGYDIVLVREPGGTAIGERIRDVILDINSDGMSPRAELLLYEAARAQLVDDAIAPALEAGKIVISDRFTDSTIAYQGAGRGISRDDIKLMNDFATDSIVPDLTIMLTCSDRADKKQRVAKRGASDRLEGAGSEFHTRVIDEYKRIADDDPERIVVIDTSKAHSESAHAIVAALSTKVTGLDDPSLQPKIEAAIEEYAAAHDHSHDGDVGDAA